MEEIKILEEEGKSPRKRGFVPILVKIPKIIVIYGILRGLFQTLICFHALGSISRNQELNMLAYLSNIHENIKIHILFNYFPYF